MHERVDIVCLVHNQLAVTRGFVQYLFRYTDNFHLIFVDNGSTDDTREFLVNGEKDGKWEVVLPGTNLGIIKGRNLGAKYVTADYFVNIDNDQYVKEGWLDSLFKLIEKGYDIVGSEAWRLLPPKTPGAIVIHDTIIPDRSYYPYRHCSEPHEQFSYIGCGGSLIKKEVYDKIGLFDERFSPAYYEDPDFCYDKETFIYTDSGFIRFDEVNESVFILTRNENDILVYQRPRWIIKKHEKELLHFCNKNVDIMCSKNQKLLVGYNRLPSGMDRGEFKSPDFVAAEDIAKELVSRQTRYFIEKAAGKWLGISEDIIIETKKWKLRDFAVFMAWYLSGGSICYDIDKRRHNKDYDIIIYQDQNRDMTLHLTDIQSSIHKLGFVSWKNSEGVVFSSKWFAVYLNRFGEYHDRYIPSEIKNAIPAIIENFLSIYAKGSGHISVDGQKWSFYTASTIMKNDLIELLIKCGRSFTYFYKDKLWQIQSHARSIAYLPPARVVSYDDYVYDVNVDNHKILIMRNGKSCWSSNCFRAIQAGFKLGWKSKCAINHLAHQTIYSQHLFNKNVQFVRSWVEFQKKWMPYYPDLIHMSSDEQ